MDMVTSSSAAGGDVSSAWGAWVASGAWVGAAGAQLAAINASIMSRVTIMVLRIVFSLIDILTYSCSWLANLFNSSLLFDFIHLLMF
jgi:hypothetical protein